VAERAGRLRFDQFVFHHLVYTPTTWLRGEPLSRCLAELEASQWVQPIALRQLQETKLNQLVDFAAEHVPYYRERIDRSRHPKRLSLADLRHFPLLTKDDLRQHRSALVPTGFRRTSVKTTGGSTGQAVTISKSRVSTAYELAAMWRGWGWAGVHLGDRQARFWGVPLSTKARWRASLVDFVSHRKRFTAFGMVEQSMAEISGILKRFQPDYVYGYVSILHEYANYLVQTGSRQFRPKAVIATSEVLTPAHRDIIARGFGCPVFEEYGCGELGNIAHQCDRHSLHLSSENLIIEVLTDGSLAGPAQVGEIIATELNNHAMPLIRYQLRDFGALSPAQCECGRTLPVLASVFGRAYDLVYNREGRLFHGEFFMYIFEEAKQLGLGIDAFQVIQQDTDHFLIRVRPGNGYGAPSEQFVTRRIQDGYGDYAQVQFQQVPAIEREASGKLRLIIAAQGHARSS
jgi:phenylacetate-CoA ligase